VVRCRDEIDASVGAFAKQRPIDVSTLVRAAWHAVKGEKLPMSPPEFPLTEIRVRNTRRCGAPTAEATAQSLQLPRL
jgi:hypothetical protein